MRFRRIDPKFHHPPGHGPFSARGIVYSASLEYIRLKTPGGVAAVMSELGSGADDLRAFFDRIFVAGAKYDVVPLVALHAAAARLEATLVEKFAEARSRESADMDIRGVYRVMLRFASPVRVAENLPRAFARYFSPCRVVRHEVSPGRIFAVFGSLPADLAGWYASACNGFVSRALELAGAKNLRCEWSSPRADEPVGGVETVGADYVVSWRT